MVQYVIAVSVQAEFLMAQIHVKRQSTVQHTGQQPQYSDRGSDRGGWLGLAGLQSGSREERDVV